MFPLGIKEIRNFFQESGKFLLAKMLLKTSIIAMRILSCKQDIRSLSILSKPRADLNLQKYFWRKIDSFFIEKGLINNSWARGLGQNKKTWGNYKRKRTGGQMDEIKFNSFSILVELVGALEGSRFPWWKRLIIFQKTKRLVKEEGEEQKFLNDSSLTCRNILLAECSASKK